MPSKRFTLDALPATPWKNGGGVTREIACLPAGAGPADFEWRVSIALIAAAGPFSAFPGVDRVITLLDGAGVRLRSPGGGIDHRLEMPLAPFAFAGEAPIQAELLGGPCHDLNVMVRRGRHRAVVQVLRAAHALPPASAGMLLGVRGSWVARSPAGESIALPGGAGVWWHELAGGWRVDLEPGGGTLVAVLLFPVPEPQA